MASVPLLSSAEEAEEYDLLPAPSTSSSSSSSPPHSQSRRRSSGSGSRLSWLPDVQTKLGGSLALAAAVVVGLVGGRILLPSSSLLPLLPPSSSSPSGSSPNPFTLPGLILNRPILPPEAKVDEPWGWYDKVRWKPIPSLTSLASGEGRLTRREGDGLDGDAEQEEPSLLEELKLAHERGVVPEGWSDWGVNKTILGIGDSLIRNNLLFFSQHIAQDIGRYVVPFRDEQGSLWSDSHAQGMINVPVVNLKLLNYFHMGMIESPTPGFFVNESLPQNFEEKLANVFIPALDDPKGLNGRVPDLIIFESLSWDLVLLSSIAVNAGDRRFGGRPMDDIELEFLRGRIVSVLGLLRRTFPTSKIVIQTPHLGAKPPDANFSPIRKYQQAQIMASIALETGLDLFDWGRIVSSLSHELTDGLHFRPGAATWIWGEMVLYYLREAARFKTSPPPPAPASDTPPSPRLSQEDLIRSYAQPKQDHKQPWRRTLPEEEVGSLEAAMRLLSK